MGKLDQLTNGSSHRVLEANEGQLVARSSSKRLLTVTCTYLLDVGADDDGAMAGPTVIGEVGAAPCEPENKLAMAGWSVPYATR